MDVVDVLTRLIAAVTLLIGLTAVAIVLALVWYVADRVGGSHGSR